VALSLDALAWLRAAGARQIYFKVCSTFDSTDRGNIGPVAEALMNALDCASRSPARRSRRTSGRSSTATCSSAPCR
jgi:uncharacterized protein YgbK (DUF1537 family)